MDKRAFFSKVEEIHKKTGKGRIGTIIDMQRCAVRHGAGYIDYDLFEMYNLNEHERATYLTRGRNNAIVKKYNNAGSFHIFENKSDFNARFESFLNREWIDAQASGKEAAIDFINRHSVIFSKPTCGACGKGIEKVLASEFGSAEECYSYLLSLEGPRIWEEQALQHPDMDKMYPGAINTVRAVTLLINGAPQLITAMLRIGNGKHVDNFNSGGMAAPVDVGSGIVSDFALDKQKTRFEKHPVTGTQIKGFALPDWEEAKALVLRACKVVPEMGYIGWDIAFTPDGPILIEGNEFPGHDIYQLPEHTPSKIGIMPVFAEAERKAKEAAKENLKVAAV
ncbi:MAG: hypothetical protein FWG30_00200 [Eubacteriaceae bacterium]|nr:hypothetical protein [Eubacteriaceae bacterium]